MKMTLGIILALSTTAFILMGFIKKNLGDTETHAYEVLHSFDEFEIRKYAPALYSSVSFSSNSYKQVSSSGFRTLAGYIFGDNATGEQIAMTSPVTMEFQENAKMMFLVPSHLNKADLPRPNNEEITFEEAPERIVAAVRFGGWANDEKIKRYQEKLTELLAAEGIVHFNNFAYLGYNPPYDVVNRKNEIIVEVEWIETANN
ncbi:MAG: heme-binding protein [Crocinitomicaceae bacterium]|nr:heme-binding protein [Crocinitomicaceae bacterium]